MVKNGRLPTVIQSDTDNSYSFLLETQKCDKCFKETHNPMQECPRIMIRDVSKNLLARQRGARANSTNFPGGSGHRPLSNTG